MTEDDLARIREVLTHDMLEDVWAVANGHTRGGEDIAQMRDVLMSALAPLVRPAPTCATCQAADACAILWEARHHSRLPNGSVDFGCTLYTPRPSTPEGSASR